MYNVITPIEGSNKDETTRNDEEEYVFFHDDYASEHRSMIKLYEFGFWLLLGPSYFQNLENTSSRSRFLEFSTIPSTKTAS